MRKEGRLRDAIEMFELVGTSPSYMLKAQAQIGLCHRSMGDYETAIQAFRAVLSAQSVSRKEVIDVQYFLARTLESVGRWKKRQPSTAISLKGILHIKMPRVDPRNSRGR